MPLSVHCAFTHTLKAKISTPSRAPDRKELDSLIETLVGDKSRDRSAGTSSPSGRKKSRPSSVFGTENIGAESYDGASSQLRPEAAYTSASTQTSSTTPVETSNERTPALSSKPATEVLTYSKGVQTSELWSSQPQQKFESLSDSDADESPSALRSPSKRQSRRKREREEEIRQNLRREIEEELKATRDLDLNDPVVTGPTNFPARNLTDEEVDAVTASEDFLEFVERSSKVIEKALDQDYDVLADYALDGAEVESDDDEGYGSSRGKKGRRVRQITQFYDERLSKKRMISDMNFSPKVRPRKSCEALNLT